jgi:hypothetical protein
MHQVEKKTIYLRHEVVNPKNANRLPQDSEPELIALPYWPRLKGTVGSVNAALAVSFLETHYPSPPPELGRRYGLPVEVDFARMAEELAVDNRTLGLAFMCVSTWFESERQRLGSVRAGREFVNLKHSRFPRIKLYSIVAEREWKSLRTLTLRRNWPLLTKTLADCGITNICAVPSSSSVPRDLPRQDLDKLAASPSPFASLPEILMRGVELAQDRRKTRYVRLRRAMKQGVELHEAKRVHRKPSADNEAVDPVLGDELVARLSRNLR